MDVKFSTVLAIFSNQTDRFCPHYKEGSKSIEELFNDASKVKEHIGLELVETWDINEENINVINKLIKKYDFKIVSIIMDLFSKGKWAEGTFTSKDPNIRRQTIDKVKRYMDIAAELGCDLVNLWSGQDGYDYIFKSNYLRAWDYLIEGIKECVEHRNDIRIGLEYKIREPRTHCYIDTVGKTLTLVNNINKDNLGVIVDAGHALCAQENMAETIVLCKLFGNKLFHLHLNDNYRFWDDDMMVSSVHIPEYLELLYWLRKTKYEGWYSFDLWPAREDAIEAVNECIEWTKSLLKVLDNTSEEEIEKIINEGNSAKSMALLRRMLFK